MPIDNNQLVVFKEITSQMLAYQNGHNYYRHEALGALLKLFFINVSGACHLSKSVTETEVGGNDLIQRFKKLIEKNYKSRHQVKEYANLLAVSSDYLNRFVKNKTGKSAKEYIQDKLMIEAQRMLLFTELTAKELAFELGFEEPSHFNSFFKKVNGLSPIAFRQKIRK